VDHQRRDLVGQIPLAARTAISRTPSRRFRFDRVSIAPNSISAGGEDLRPAIIALRSPRGGSDEIHDPSLTLAALAALGAGNLFGAVPTATEGVSSSDFPFSPVSGFPSSGSTTGRSSAPSRREGVVRTRLVLHGTTEAENRS